MTILHYEYYYYWHILLITLLYVSFKWGNFEMKYLQVVFLFYRSEYCFHPWLYIKWRKIKGCQSASFSDLNKFNVNCVDCFSPCNDRLALIIKHGSSLGYLSSWPYPYHYGASCSTWFTTLSQSFRNLSSGKDVGNHVIHEQWSERGC